MKQPRSLAAKLCSVMKVVQKVAERGHNDLDGYNYATEGDIKEAFRMELAKRNVLCFPTVLEEQRVPIVLHLRGGDVDSVVTRQKVKFQFFDGDTPEILAATVWGAGEDAKDKGDAKALTGALKSLLRTAFMIPSGDDPDEATQTGAVGKEIRQKKVDAAQEIAADKLAGTFVAPARRSLFYFSPEESNGHHIAVTGDSDALTTCREPLMFHGKFIGRTQSYKVPTEKLEELREVLAGAYKCDLKAMANGS